jgi:hypothetical protein
LTRFIHLQKRAFGVGVALVRHLLQAGECAGGEFDRAELSAAVVRAPGLEIKHAHRALFFRGRAFACLGEPGKTFLIVLWNALPTRVH